MNAGGKITAAGVLQGILEMHPMKLPDLSKEISLQYESTLKLAQAAEKKGSAQDAASKYRRAAELMRQYADYSTFAEVKSNRQNIAAQLEERARELLGAAKAVRVPQLDSRSGANQNNAQGEDDYEGIIKGYIRKTNVSWNDIGGLESTKEAIKSAYVMALAKKPSGVSISPLRNILFYGPPGTGKTTLAAAIAGNLQATFFSMRGSGLLSKYFGESSKLVETLFVVARQMAPSVIYLDEFEALVPQRGSGESGAERRIVSEFLAALEGMDKHSDNSFVLTIVATNYPWLIDDAILSRFRGMPIYIPLPDAPARKAIFQIHLFKQGHKSDVAVDELVKRSDGYSGREIEQVCQQAILHMLRRANAGMADLADKGLDVIRDHQLLVEPVSRTDMNSAFEKVLPGTRAEALKRYDDWRNQNESNRTGAGG